ncbi:hypothetical protein B296_00009474 [Ensete ventricosum]|uniref:Uncharacterized protein n=1 Tax=Ensete ventricosum TaxID=4639 RepID=A0A427AUR6_ENSVE|nr:hypothetical protein B296_00009474 [Ensete ventricosum]
MAKHHGESSKMGQAGPLPQAVVSGLQVQTRSKTTGAAHEERGSEHDEREVGYSPQAEEAQSSAPTGKRSHKERLSTVETRIDVLKASLEELYQGQGRLFGVESSQEEAESWIDRVESLVDQLTEDTKDSVQHLHEVPSCTEHTSPLLDRYVPFVSRQYEPLNSTSRDGQTVWKMVVDPVGATAGGHLPRRGEVVPPGGGEVHVLMVLHSYRQPVSQYLQAASCVVIPHISPMPARIVAGGHESVVFM